jgi:integrase
VPVSELKKGHLERWLKQQTAWRSTATQRNAVTAVLSAFLHADEEAGIPNPLRGFAKPPQRPRLHSITPEDEAAIYKQADPAFADFLFAAIHTGLRPFCELAQLTPAQVITSPRGMLWKVPSPKTGKTRVIPVQDAVAERTKRRLRAQDAGRVFRNHQNNPWKKPTAGMYFREIRRALDWDRDPAKSQYTCYSCRHTFAHRMLSGYWNEGKGCSIETLAELLGDTPKVAFDHYGREWGQHYQDPLWAAIGVAHAK